MKSTRVVSSVDPDVAPDLEFVASKTPFRTANMLLAAAGAELAKLRIKSGPKDAKGNPTASPDDQIHNIWHALARIADVEGEAPQAKRLPARALEIAR